MSYQWLTDPLCDTSGYALVSLRSEDMVAIGHWRNEQMAVLRQSQLLTDAGQAQYFESIVAPSMSVPRPAMVLVSFLLRGNCIGYGGLTNIDWDARRGEVSFLVATARTRDPEAYGTDFLAFLGLLKELSFARLRLGRLFTETYDIRPGHVATLEMAGFRREGRLRGHYRIDGVAVDALFHGLLREEYGV